MRPRGLELRIGQRWHRTPVKQ
uniref:Uncharacterized protein n=1 Tax=Arundo donax TaxID=35708 RepID=A0A0A9BST3_ARUDO